MKHLPKLAGTLIAMIAYGLCKDFEAVDYVAWFVVISAVALPFFAFLEGSDDES
jgi:hypothetical protein